MEDRIIANIIYKELFSYSAVYLPQVGYVSFAGNPAVLSPDGNSVTPPCRTLAVYPSDANVAPCVHIVNAICQSMSVEPQSALDMYNSYIRRNTDEINVLTIPYVMRIDLNDMSVPSVDERLKNAMDMQMQMQAPLVLREAPAPAQAPSRANAHARPVRVPYRLSSAPRMWEVVLSAIAVSAAAMYLVYRYFLIDLI